MKKLLLCWVVCAASITAARFALAAGDTPALVVVVSVDQFAYEYLDRFRAGFDDAGIFRRCEREGAWYTNCHHRHGVTTTAPGHSVQLTGAYPSTNGIVDNGWLDRATGRQCRAACCRRTHCRQKAGKPELCRGGCAAAYHDYRLGVVV